ncbi:glycosyltransferase family 4 protein [Fictibacillus aquaticus]|uniref:Glycosyl transferase family 1 n=1 Tax=Fictibacillus aquaticus TaxID=2021314 RepID=A0A235FEI9_9BACL|nr:glycosyltransferase family 4 protein [Fictibacillus aquaticus]OYD59768.1 glycosyl transferase family 1 [Fictibacillus aquaticus]
MNILLTTVFDYPHAGGLSTHVTTLKAGLEARGHSVDVVSISDASPAKIKMMAQGPSFVINKVAKGKGIIWSRKARQRILAQLIKEKVKTKKYDVINAQDTYATFASLESGVPVVSTVHGYMAFEAVSKGSVEEHSPEAKYLQEMEKKAFQTTRKVITVDQRIKNYVADQAGITATAIKNFIDINGFKPDSSNKMTYRKKHGVPEEAKMIFIPRRLTKKNGVIYPAMALKEVVKQYPEALLIYAGSGEEMGTIKKFVAENGLEKNVKLLGAIPHDTMKEYYAMTDIVLVPSVYSAGVEEATSISALEAMGSGSPLIASAVGGLKEIVDSGVDGILTEEKNVDELIEAILQLFGSKELSETYAVKARTKIEEEYSHLAAAEKYEAIYLEALKQK